MKAPVLPMATAGMSIALCILLAAARPAFSSSPEITGRVLDFQSRQPIAGAYVVSIYVVVRGDIAASAIWCVKTKGTTTDASGGFRFAAEPADDIRPHVVSAIKADYRGDSMPAIGADRNIYLRRQDPKAPALVHGSSYEFCDHAPYYEDAAAGLEYLKMAEREREKYGAPKNSLKSAQYLIDRLEALPRRAGLTK